MPLERTTKALGKVTCVRCQQSPRASMIRRDNARKRIEAVLGVGEDAPPSRGGEDG